MTVDGHTHVIVLTAAGRSALATVLVEGDQALASVTRYFRRASGAPLASCSAGRILFGRWQADDAEGEDIVVCRTGQGSFEITCHGGMASTKRIVASLVDAGCIPIEWQEWLELGRSPCLRTEALIAVSQAKTQRTAAILLQQFRGVLDRQLENVITMLRDGRTDAATQDLRQMLDFSRVGLHLTTPWNVVVAGPPNVGKSSLVNALLGYHRAIAFDQPGTTRDVLAATAAFDGWPIRLFDTAGLHDTTDEIEAAGVRQAVQSLVDADLVVLVFDASRDWTSSDDALITAHPDACRVHNKTDLVACENPDRPTGHWTGATSGTGIGELAVHIVQTLVPRVPDVSDPVPFRQRQINAIKQAAQAIDQSDWNTAINSLMAARGSQQPAHVSNDC